MTNLSERYDDLKKGKKRKKKKKAYKQRSIDKMVISHIVLKRILGFIGILLPFALMFCSSSNYCIILPSISDYYHTSAQLIFTSALISIAIFLFSYNGESNEEKILYNIAALFALLIAVFPTPIGEEFVMNPDVKYTIDHLDQFRNISPSNPKFVGNVHFICATFFFLILSYLVFFRFTKAERKSHHFSINRVRLYKICGVGMLLSILFIAVSKFWFFDFFKDSNNWTFPIIFASETIALVLFGVSWLVKGEIELFNINNL